MHVLRCDIMCPLYYARTYPATTQKGVADLCLYQLHAMHVHIKIFSLYVAIGTYA